MRNISQVTNHIVNGDCLAILPEVPAGSVDFVLTDPPYLVGYRDRHGRSMGGDKSAEWLEPAFAQAFRVLKPNTFCVSFYGWNRADEFLAAWRAASFRVVGHLVWIKSYASSRGVLAYCHEQAYLLAKGNPPRPMHPTQKPVRSLKPIIEAFSSPGEIVLDPFCGSGSTLLAAKILGRRYLGIDLDAGYCQAARRRL